MTICKIGTPPFDKESQDAWQRLRSELCILQERVKSIPPNLIYEPEPVFPAPAPLEASGV